MNTSLTYQLISCVLPWLVLAWIVWLMLRPTSFVNRFGERILEGATAHGSKNGLAYLVGLCLVLGATLTSFYDNFGTLSRDAWTALGWWQIAALVMKSLSSAPAALVGYLMRSPLPANSPVTGGTTPPFAKPAAP